jgi:head-tail adaptor
MGGGLASSMTERVIIERQGSAADEYGGVDPLWAVVDAAWAAITTDGHGPELAAERRDARRRWRVTMRRRELALGDRLRWRGGVMALRSIEIDPVRRDRMVLRTEAVE